MKKIIIGLISLLCMTAANAHHSFSAFDITKKIEKTGVLTRYSFIQPHILMAIDVSLDDGTIEHWEIESLVPRKWDRLGLDKDFVKEGDTATIVGFPARDGSTSMMLSAIKTESGELVAREQINQRD
jgi:hypothetical protein